MLMHLSPSYSPLAKEQRNDVKRTALLHDIVYMVFFQYLYDHHNLMSFHVSTSTNTSTTMLSRVGAGSVDGRQDRSYRHGCKFF